MKLVFKHIVVAFVLACFLVSTTGLSLVTHYCAHSQKNFLFFFAQNPDCENECACNHCRHKNTHNNDENACCMHKDFSNCCKNTSRFLKLIDDYFSSDGAQNVDCPVFIVENSIHIEKIAFSTLAVSEVRNFAEDVGLPEQLLLKRTTEFLL